MIRRATLAASDSAGNQPSAYYPPSQLRSSIAYYLNLFGAFAVSLTSTNDQTHARIVTTAALAFVACFGWLRGFAVLERIEEGTVGLKLAIIAGLLVALVAFFFERLSSAEGPYFSGGPGFSWQSMTIALGLVITVQGFETSRYLGNEFDAKTRITTMKLSQWISTAIYVVYICLVTFCFSDDQVPESETGIIGMTKLVAPVLPAMLVAAALAAQFSAAVADTGGCGGLAEEMTFGRIKASTTYRRRWHWIDVDRRYLFDHRLCVSSLRGLLRFAMCDRRGVCHVRKT